MKVQVRRIGGVLLGVLVVGVAVGAVRLAGVDRKVTDEARAELARSEAGWQAQLAACVVDPRLAAYGVTARQPGNAAALLYPEGLAGDALGCPWFHAADPQARAWTENEAAWRAVAECPALDAFAAAAAREELDLLGVPPGEATPALLEGRQALPPQSGIGGLIARSWQRRQEQDLAGAEADLRAAVSLALAVWQAHPSGLQEGEAGVLTALRHWVDLLERQGNGPQATSLRELLAEHGPGRQCRRALGGGFMAAALVDDGVARLAAVAGRGDLPLALRLRAAGLIRLGGLWTPRGLLFQPSGVRRQALEELAADSVLSRWWPAVEGLPGLTGRERLAQGWEWLVLGKAGV